MPNTNGRDMRFTAVGSTLALGRSDFGGLVYASTQNDVYLWRPDGLTGHLVYIGGIWGTGQGQMSCDTGNVNITVYYVSGKGIYAYIKFFKSLRFM